LLLKVTCRDRAELDVLVDEEIRAVKNVTVTETFVYVRIARLPVEWGAEGLGTAIERAAAPRKPLSKVG
jgi:hypothetical protein